MALTIDLSVAIATNRESQTLTDGTTYGTGGNPARSAVGVFCQAYKVDYDNNATALTTTGNDEDPETDTSWSIQYTIDGHYLYNFVIIPDFDNTATYAQYAAVFNPSDNKVYRSRQNNNTEDDLTNTTFWEEITGTNIPGLAANKNTATESLNITSIQYRRVLSADGQYYFGTFLSDQCACSDCDESETLFSYNVWAMWLDDMSIADSRSEVQDGELLARRMETRFINAS